MAKIITLFCILFLMTSCGYRNTEDSHQIITIVNNTNKTFYVFGSTEYPKTDMYKYHPDPTLDQYSNKIEVNETNSHVLASKSSYENIFKNSISSGIMMVYVFDGETLETQGWDYIKTNNLVLKRYDLSLQDLENMNWTIVID